MAAAMVGDELVRSMSSKRMSFRSSSSKRSWASSSMREAWTVQGDVFQKSGREDDEEELMWAALERLPTYDRLRKGMLKQVLDNGRIGYEEIDVTNLGVQDKKHLIESLLKVAKEDDEKLLRRIRDRTDRVGIDILKNEVRFEHLSIEGDAYVGTMALPTLLNSTLNSIEAVLGLIKLLPSKKRAVKILCDNALLLRPPRSGKTTLLQILAGNRDKDLKESGRVSYCGHDQNLFLRELVHTLANMIFIMGK
nr:pleiotropic drug resistance protein 2 [Quercus suber]